MRKSERFHIRLVRPRFEVQYLTVRATDHEMAKFVALVEAGDDPEDWKLVDYSDEDYEPFVERCLSDNDLAANEMTLQEAKDELSSTEIPQHDKYLLLYADTASGEGDLCEHPWFAEEGALMKSDLIGDWCLDIQSFLDDGASEEDIEAELMGGEPSEKSKAMLAEVLRKQPRKKPRGET